MSWNVAEGLGWALALGASSAVALAMELAVCNHEESRLYPYVLRTVVVFHIWYTAYVVMSCLFVSAFNNLSQSS